MFSLMLLFVKNRAWLCASAPEMVGHGRRLTLILLVSLWTYADCPQGPAYFHAVYGRIVTDSQFWA
jgi:hypothetical protein